MCSLKDGLEITVISRDGCRIVRVVGDLDMRAAPRLKDALEQGRMPGTPLVVDLTRVQFLDSYGLRSLLLVNAEAGPWGAPLRIVASPAADRAIKLAGADEVLDVYRDEQHALAGPENAGRIRA